MYQYFLKRLVDLIVSLTGLIILFPIVIFVTFILSLTLKGNPFFIQKRPGLNNKIFSIVKFRTMLNTKDEQGNLLPDEQRLLGFGKIVRKLSLDEIPQLINVLKGDMSLVGPRPLLVEYLPLYNQRQARRHEVRPGITGWAQVNGRNTISWKDKFELDVWYVDHINFWLDIKIIFLTIVKVFKREGINSDTSVTMEKFLGNN